MKMHFLDGSKNIKTLSKNANLLANCINDTNLVNDGDSGKICESASKLPTLFFFNFGAFLFAILTNFFQFPIKTWANNFLSLLCHLIIVQRTQICELERWNNYVNETYCSKEKYCKKLCAKIKYFLR